MSTRFQHLTSNQKRSIYHLEGRTASDRRCEGLACFVAQGPADGGCGENPPSGAPVYCLGKCFMAPSCGSDEGRPHVAIDAPVAVVLERIAAGGARSIDDYRAAGGYAVLEDWRRMPAARLLDELEASGLRGRGGAGFSAALKWRAVANLESPEKYVVVNADEGDPGAYIDRFILEDDPHAVLESVLLAAHAVGASHGVIYVRKEYPDAWHMLEQALDEARAAGYVTGDVTGGGRSFDLELVQGEGSYICGEETALLNSLENRVPMVRLRPPYPTQAGLYGRPTLVNNVETLASIPWILRHGGHAYRRLGFSQSRGTKVVSLNSLFWRPGLYEVEFGVPVRHIVENLGGGLRTGAIQGVIIGGPLAGVIPPSLLETPFGFEELQKIGACVGHGGVVAFDHRTSMMRLMQHVFSFAANESCGQCTPCRLGARAIAEHLSRRVAGDELSSRDRTFARNIVSALHDTSLCGLGTGLADFALSLLRYYPNEVADAFRHD